MTRTNVLTVLFAALAVLGIAPAAAAHYDPVPGRWLERDPIGTPTVRIGQLNAHRQHAYSMNLYELILMTMFGLVIFVC